VCGDDFSLVSDVQRATAAASSVGVRGPFALWRWRPHGGDAPRCRPAWMTTLGVVRGAVRASSDFHGGVRGDARHRRHLPRVGYGA
jgi:hypothetical protein